MKCEECEKEIGKDEAVQHFDKYEPTTIHLFCTAQCQNKWISKHELGKEKE